MASGVLLVTFKPLFISTFLVAVLLSSLLVVLSDWKNLSLDCSVFAAVVEARGAGVGLVLIEVVVVTVSLQVVRGAVGLETEAVGLSLAGERILEAGREADEVEKVLEKVGGVLGFSVIHAGLEGVVVGAVVLVLVKSG